MAKNLSFCIIGLGRFGTHLALSLASQNYHVMAIDKDRRKLDLLAEDITDLAAFDASNERLLHESGAANFDVAVVCFSKNVSDSILATIALKSLGVEKVVTRAGSDQHRLVLEKIGADGIIYPEHDMAEKVAFELANTKILSHMEFAEGHSTDEIPVPGSWIGKSLRELDIRNNFKVNVVAVKHGESVTMVTDPDEKFRAGDFLVVAGKTERIRSLANLK